MQSVAETIVQCDSEVLWCHGGAAVVELIFSLEMVAVTFTDKVRTLSPAFLSVGFHGAV